MTRKEKIEILETEKAYMIAHGGDRQTEALTSAIQALEAIDKIKAEIEKVLNEPEYQHEGEDWGVGLCIAQQIIDKYTAEGEEKNETDN